MHRVTYFVYICIKFSLFPLMKRFLLRFFLALGMFWTALNASPAEDVSIENDFIRLSFDKKTGQLVSMLKVDTNEEFVDEKAVSSPLWMLRKADGSPLLEQEAQLLSVEEKGGNSLTFSWDGGKGLKVRTSVRLDEQKAFSYWSIELEGIGTLPLYDIRYPILQGFKKMEHEEMAVSSWLGSLIHEPRASLNKENPQRWFAWESPGFLSMQMVALYHPQKGGIYMGSNDTLSYPKRYEILLDTLHTEYAWTHTPSYRSGANTYRPTYETIVGLFEGDWLSAAQIYRQWATEQKWCRESRFHNGQTPEWAEKTALWIWNRGKSSNVLSEARHLRKKWKLPVSVFWHWWHGCSYDEGFPEYLPPREGAEPFRKAVKEAEKEKVHCIVYMNSYQWGNSTRSWKEEGAERFCAKQINGNTYSHSFNIFTGKELTPMCMATPFWRKKYATLADSAICQYGVGGIYMDQACSSMKCYDEGHGHPLGGGNYWVSGFKDLVSSIRQGAEREKKKAVLAGEGSGEDWIPCLDLFLTLEASRERYLGIGDTETIPLYQAVYHDYAMTYGNYSSLVYPPYDDLWPDQFRPANREQPLPDDFDMQFRMEQARAFVWGMQPTLANYHALLDNEKEDEMDFLQRLVLLRQKTLKYLLYGVYERVPSFEIPKQEINFSRISIYAGRSGNTVTQSRHEVPLIYSGAWRAKDGNIGICMANIAEKDLPVNFTFDPKDYGIEGTYKIYQRTAKERHLIKEGKNEKIPIHLQIGARNACMVEIERTNKKN